MALTSELSIRFIRPAIGQTLWARVNINAINGRRYYFDNYFMDDG